METCVIPEPQRTYVLELLAALGPTAGKFVIAGAQAIKFMVKDARNQGLSASSPAENLAGTRASG
jgi:hypothetical protein